MWWHRRHRTARSQRLALRRRKIFIWKAGGVLACVIFLVTASWWVLNRPYLQIDTIVIHGNNVISDQDIKGMTEGILGGTYFFLFPRTNSLIYPLQEIENSLLRSFIQIESVDIIRTDFKTVSMEIREQKPHALWCTVNPEDIQDCYFLNRKEGLIFSKAPNFTGNVFFRFYGDLEIEDPIGVRYLKVNDEFNQVNVLIDSIKKLGLQPIELHIVDLKDVEIYMEDESKIIFTREQSTFEVLANLKAVLRSETFKEEKTKNIEYIDLRFGNKVYFKTR